jgi:hypothetical protein
VFLTSIKSLKFECKIKSWLILLLDFSSLNRQFFATKQSNNLYFNLMYMSKLYIPIRPSKSTSEIDELDEAEED